MIIDYWPLLLNTICGLWEGYALKNEASYIVAENFLNGQFNVILIFTFYVNNITLWAP